MREFQNLSGTRKIDRRLCIIFTCHWATCPATNMRRERERELAEGGGWGERSGTATGSRTKVEIKKVET